MNIRTFTTLLLLLFGCNLPSLQARVYDLPDTVKNSIDTRIGKLHFTHDFYNGYPTCDTQRKLLDEIDFQRACQAYLWSIPIVSMAQMQYSFQCQLGYGNGQIMYIDSFHDRLGGLTFNATTPYVLAFIDLSQEPYVIELPEGDMRGGVLDFWQISFSMFGHGRKYIVVGPEQDERYEELKNNTEFTVLQSPTNNILAGFRMMSKNVKERSELLADTKIYPLSQHGKAYSHQPVTPEGRKWEAWHPRGVAYWERLADIINREPVQERDRFFMAMLRPLGIEKGKPFLPDERQRKILEEAALVGEAMAKANDFHNTRIEEAAYRKGSHWEYAAVCPPDQRHEYYDDLDGRAKWFYEAVTNSLGMHGHETGKGQVYMAAYKDRYGNWLDGAKNYVLHLPAEVPAEVFWSFTVYDVASRALLDSGEGRADLSSHMDLHINPDGSIDLYIGPDKPKDSLHAENWIRTLPGKSWFAYFRLYSPEEEFMTQEWVLPDIERMDN